LEISAGTVLSAVSSQLSASEKSRRSLVSQESNGSYDELGGGKTVAFCGGILVAFLWHFGGGLVTGLG